jgi:phosphate transport system substrate-binding protein
MKNKIFSTSSAAFLIFALIIFIPTVLLKESTVTDVRISGSTSVNPLMTEILKNTTTPATIVSAKGSSTGIKDLLDGNADIAMVSRKIEKSESEKFKQNDMSEITIALDPMAVIIHNDNPIKNLTKEQIKKIYLGEYKNWREIDPLAPDMKIFPIARPSSSGTRDAFDSAVGIKKGTLLAPNTIEKGETGECKIMVAENKGAISYVSLHAADNAVGKVTVDNVEATEKNVQTNKYKLSRPFVLAYKNETQTLKLIEEIKSDKIQQVIRDENYVTPTKEGENK